MRVLLVYASRSRDLMPAAPIGLAYVATACRAAGHRVCFLDLLMSRRPGADLRRTVREFQPEVVGMSVRNIDSTTRQRVQLYFTDVLRQLAAIRQESSAPIVVGGPAVSILRSAALECLDAEFALVGEGEAAFPRLLAELGGAREFARVPGLCWRDARGTVATEPEVLGRFGPSRMEDWVDWGPYELAGATWPLQTKRGCLLRCLYCAYATVEGCGTRCRPAAEVVDEIERVASTIGPRAFEIVDSAFNVPVEPALELCEEIIRRGIKVVLTTSTVNPLTASRELFALMRRAGFNSMMVTPEAASEKTLESLRKGFTTEHVRAAARLARDSGLRSAWFFMLGGPGETRETAEETVSFIEDYLDWPGSLVICTTGIRVLPGTELAGIARQEGIVDADSDLVRPVFYLSPRVSEAWLLARVNQAIRRHPNVVHAAEEDGSRHARPTEWALRLAGVTPPYWRFLPDLLRLPPVRFLRSRFLLPDPSVSADPAR